MKAPGQQRCEGVSAVEFALILPLLLVILLGIIEFGWAFFLDLTITNAAREGARVGVTLDWDPPSDAVDDIRLKTGDYLSAANAALFSAASIDVETPYPVSGATTAQYVEVVVSLPYIPLTNFIPSSLLPTNLAARSKMRWELSP